MELDYKKVIRAILKSNQRYPRRAIDRGIQGTVFLAFTVNKNGELLGIMSGIFTKESDTNVGVNFAISSILLNKSINHLIK